MHGFKRSTVSFVATTTIVAAMAAGGAVALPSGDTGYGPWQVPVNAETGSDPALNSVANDGCPIMSPDGLDLYMASNREGSQLLDIWVAHREKTTDGWGAPERLPEPVNSADNDFCPSPARGHRLFFVSKRTEPNGDIYVTRKTERGWEAPQRLGPNINSPAQEWSPSYFELEDGTPVLYFSSTRNGNNDIFVSVNWGPAQPVTELNTAEFEDARPNVRHDGKEIVFDSTRPHEPGGPAVNPDVWTATRSSATGKWSAPHPIDAVNSPAGESRASLSWDGRYMVFGSSRRETNEGPAGTTDIFMSYRSLKGH